MQERAEQLAKGEYPVTEKMIHRTIKHGYPHRKSSPRSSLRIASIHAYQPVWSMGSKPDIPVADGGYLAAFKGYYTEFYGPLTQEKVMRALYEQLKAIGGADHRFIEGIRRSGKIKKGKPVYDIQTGS